MRVPATRSWVAWSSASFSLSRVMSLSAARTPRNSPASSYIGVLVTTTWRVSLWANNSISRSSMASPDSTTIDAAVSVVPWLSAVR